MMKRTPHVACLGSLIVTMCGLSACVNVSSLQTAQTLDQGQIRMHAAAGVYPVPILDSDEGDAVRSAAAPAAEVGVRYGIMENLDAGARLTIPGTAALDAKYRFFEQNGLALAAGLSVGTLGYSLGSGTSELKGRFIDTMIPIYASIDLAKFFSVYLVPKYLLRTRIETLNGDRDIALGNFVGSSGGIKIGDTAGVFLEGTYMVGLDEGRLVQGTGAFFFSF